MLILVTGEPGAGKTLNTIKLVSEDEQFKGREVYYHGIKDFKGIWHELTDEEVQRWYELPKGCVVLVDECQYHFKPRRTGSELPKSVLEMSTHRHLGIDLILITQHPTLIDAGLRKFVNRHYHYERPFNTRRPRRLEFQQCANDPRDYHARKNAITTTLKLDEKYFDKYKSAEVHTHKQRIPKKVWLLLLLTIGLVLFGLNFANGLMSRYQTPDDVILDPTEFPGSFAPSSEPSLSYFELWSPRIDGLPHTAPVYDELNKPKVRPMPNCVLWNSGSSAGQCTCYTQQATKMNVPHDLCKSIIANGFFDPAKEPRDLDKTTKKKKDNNSNSAHPIRNNLVFIDHTPRPRSTFTSNYGGGAGAGSSEAPAPRRQ